MINADDIRRGIALMCDADRRPEWPKWVRFITVGDIVEIAKSLPAETEGPQKQ